MQFSIPNIIIRILETGVL